MQVLEVRNVHDALLRGLELLEVHGITRDSRNGLVREATSPVTTVYHRPQEKVLFWDQRVANPFFHFMELTVGDGDLISQDTTVKLGTLN